MGFGKVALFSFTCLVFVNYSMAICTPTNPPTTTITLDDISPVGTLISAFAITSDNRADFKKPTIATAETDAYIVDYFDGAGPEETDVRIYTGPEFGNLVEHHGLKAEFVPGITFNCDTVDFPLSSAQITVTMSDKNNQIPIFDAPNVINFDLALYNETSKTPLGVFHINDADIDVANKAVVVTKQEGTSDEVIVETGAIVDGVTPFTVRLAAPIGAGQHNITLLATNVGLGEGAGTKTQTNTHTIQLFFTAPSSAIQQGGAFIMVAILSVASGFSGKY